MPNDLTGQFIANTFQNLIQKPDIDKEEYYNGIGLPTYINGDPIGTVKMFYPIGGTLSVYFDTSTGLGNLSTGWDGWALADGRNGTPDLRGRVPFGTTNTGNISTVGNSNANASEFLSIGATGGSSIIGINNIPPHRHKYFDSFLNAIDGSSVFSTDVDSHASSESVDQGYIHTSSQQIQEGGSDGRDAVWYDRNTSDGTNNINNQSGLKSTPDNFYTPYLSIVYVVKIS